MSQKETKTKNDSNTQKQTNLNQKPPPDGGYGWVILGGAFIVSFILDGIMYSFGLILDPIRKDTNSEDSVANLLSSCNTGFLFCSGPIVSGLVKQFGCRSVVIGGAAVTALMYFLTSISDSIYLMIMTYGVIGGISTGCCYLASLIIIPDYFDKKRGIATGITMAGSGVGSFVLPPIIGYLITANDWKFCMSVCACVVFETCVFGAFLKPLNPIQERTTNSTSNKKQVELKRLSQNFDKNNNNISNDNEEDDEDESDLAAKRSKIIQTYNGGSMCSLNNNDPNENVVDSCIIRNKFLQVSFEILKEMLDFRLVVQNKKFFLIALSNFFCFLGYFTPFLYLVKICKEFGSTETQASFLISIIGIINIPFRMLFGIIADRKIFSAVNLNTFCVLICTLPLFLFSTLKKAYITQIIFSVLFAIGIAGMNCLTTMYLCEIVGLKRFANANGIVNLFRGFGCFLGPFLSGIIAKITGRESDTFIFSGICFFIGLCLSLLCSFGNCIQYLSKKPQKEMSSLSNEMKSSMGHNLNEEKMDLN